MHFVINIDNRKTIGFCSNNDVKYVDVMFERPA